MTTRRKPVDREGQEQIAFFQWLELQHPAAALLTFHPANGGSRTKAEAGKFKAQGVRAGVQDIVMDVPRGAYHGLRIELKATPPHDSSIADSQKGWNRRHRGQGYCALICKGVDAARAVTTAYLDLGPFDGKTELGFVCALAGVAQ